MSELHNQYVLSSASDFSDINEIEYRLDSGERLEINVNDLSGLNPHYVRGLARRSNLVLSSQARRQLERVAEIEGVRRQFNLAFATCDDPCLSEG